MERSSAFECLKKRRRVILPARAQPPLLPVLMPGYNSGNAEAHGGLSRNAKTRQSSWHALPVELLLLVFRYLSAPRDRRTALLICRNWHDAMIDHSLWATSCVVVKRSNAPLWLWKRVLQDRQVGRVDLTRFDRWTVVPSAVAKLAKLSVTLTSLNIKVLELAQVGMVTSLKHLNTLSILVKKCSGGSPLSDLLECLPLLVELKIAAVQRGSLCLNIERLTHAKLRILKLENLEFSEQCEEGRSMLVMDSMPRLQRVDLRKCAIDSMTCSVLIGPQCSTQPSLGPSELSIISLAHSSLENMPEVPDDFRLVSTAALKQVTSLDLSSCRMTEAVLCILVDKMTCLKSLDISGNQATDTFLKHLSKCLDTLVAINLARCCDITAKGVQELSVQSLQNLGLAGCTSADTTSLLTKLPELFPDLTSLCVSHWKSLTDDNLMLLTTLRQLRKLSVSEVSLSEEAVVKFRAHYKNKIQVNV